ncbi:MAG: hypothetical protein IJZ16_07645 [Clostridia bacterium]|nr:hypothetical protein [Clostridia bacterium]
MMNIPTMLKQLHDMLFISLKRMNMLKYSFGHKMADTKEKVLTSEQKKEIKKFYSKYGKVSYVFHNFYTEKTGVFSEKYVPDNMYYNKINMFYCNQLIVKYLDNKCYYNIMFPDILQPVVLVTRKGDCWFAGKELVTFDEMLDIICEEDAVFIKNATNSSGGGGVKLVEKAECEDFRKAITEVVSKINVDVVIQRRIIQHKDFARLNETSVNTMRILTVLRNGEVKVYSSVIRIGKPNAKIDNYSSGGMSVGITEDGKLKEYAYFFNGDRITQHPSSDIEFKGYQLPYFDRAIEMVKKAHFYVPHFKMVSWDVAIREDGAPILVEANLSDGQIDLHQLCNGPLFGDDTKMILDEVFSK